MENVKHRKGTKPFESLWIWGHSSDGRASALQAESPEFESPWLHDNKDIDILKKRGSSMLKEFRISLG